MCVLLTLLIFSKGYKSSIRKEKDKTFSIFQTPFHNASTVLIRYSRSAQKYDLFMLVCKADSLLPRIEKRGWYFLSIPNYQGCSLNFNFTFTLRLVTLGFSMVSGVDRLPHQGGIFKNLKEHFHMWQDFNFYELSILIRILRFLSKCTCFVV